MMTGCCWSIPACRQGQPGRYQRGDRQLRLQLAPLAPRATLPQEFRLLGEDKSIATDHGSYFDALDKTPAATHIARCRSLDLAHGRHDDLERSARQRNARR